MAAAVPIGVEDIRSIFHDSWVIEEQRLSVLTAVEIKLPEVAGKASFLFHALEFLITPF